MFSIGECCPNQQREMCVCVCVCVCGCIWSYVKQHLTASEPETLPQGNPAQSIDWMAIHIWRCHVVGIFVRLN